MAKKWFTAEQIIMNQRRPHSASAYRAEAPEAQLPRSQAPDPIPWSGLQRVPGLT